MQPCFLQDRVSRGLGIAARTLGHSYDAFRPASAALPMDPVNRFLKLPAAFAADGGAFRRQPEYGKAVWAGLFDTAYTRPGDFLAGPAGIFFIAVQEPFQPALCILTNRVITVSRPAVAAAAGVNGYGGNSAAPAEASLVSWPASVLVAGGGPAGDLPGSGSPGFWTVLLPQTPAAIRSADLLTDEDGRIFVVNTAERSALGWRLGVRQAAS